MVKSVPKTMQASERVRTASTITRRDFVLAVTLALALESCAKPVAPTVTPKAVRVLAVRPVGLELSLELDVYNPNGFPLVVSSVEGTVELFGGTELGRTRANLSGHIPAKSTRAVTSQVSVAWTNLSALAPFLLSQQPVDYRFRGVAAIGGDRLNVSVPFELKGSLTRAELLELGLGNLRP